MRTTSIFAALVLAAGLPAANPPFRHCAEDERPTGTIAFASLARARLDLYLTGRSRSRQTPGRLHLTTPHSTSTRHSRPKATGSRLFPSVTATPSFTRSAR